MHTFWPWVNGGTHFNKAPTPWRALPYAWSLDLTFLLLNWLLDQQTVTCIKITVHPMESSRACRDISEGELSFVRRPWIFGVWHNNSGWSHAQEILKLKPQKQKTGSEIELYGKKENGRVAGLTGGWMPCSASSRKRMYCKHAVFSCHFITRLCKHTERWNVHQYTLT